MLKSLDVRYKQNYRLNILSVGEMIQFIRNYQIRNFKLSISPLRPVLKDGAHALTYLPEGAWCHDEYVDGVTGRDEN